MLGFLGSFRNSISYSLHCSQKFRFASKSFLVLRKDSKAQFSHAFKWQFSHSFTVVLLFNPHELNVNIANHYPPDNVIGFVHSSA